MKRGGKTRGGGVRARPQEIRHAPKPLRVGAADGKGEGRVEQIPFGNHPLLRCMFDACRDGVLVLDKDLTILEHNAAVEKKLGARGVGEKCFQILAGRSTPCEECAAARAMQTGALQRLTMAPRAGEAGLWLQFSATPVRGENGEVLGAVEFVRDATERVRVEEALKESEARLRAIYEASPIGIAVTDTDGRIVSANPAFCGLCGYTEPELRELMLADITHPDDFAREFLQFQQVLQGRKESYALEKRFKKKDGSWVWGALSVAVARIDKERPLVAIGMVEDITERKLAEEELRRYQTQLQGLAHNLVTAEERERRQISAGLHDSVQQPLALAKLKIDQLGAGAPHAQSALLREISGLLEEAIERTRLFIFEVSSPILYDLGLEPALQWLVEEHRKHFGTVCHLACSPAISEIGEELSVVLFRAVRELLMNVGKHAKASQVSIDLRRDDGALALRVTDNGVGCDPALCAGGRAPKRQFGLLSLRESARRLGGALEIESTPGQGMRVTFTLPDDASARGEPRA
jgi:PAS domain S-box-containing protein